MAIISFFTEFQQPIPRELIARIMSHLPPSLQKQASRFHRWQDINSNLLGKFLLQKALNYVGRSPDLSRLQYSIHRKPFLPDGPNFSISHSGNRVACAVSIDNVVGIDIEFVTDITLNEFKSQLTTTEWEHLITAPYKYKAFFDIWTAKESITKADGRGITIDLKKLEVVGGHPVNLEGKIWHLTQLTNLDGFSCHLASEHIIQMGDLILKDFDINDLLKST